MVNPQLHNFDDWRWMCDECGKDFPESKKEEAEKCCEEVCLND